MALDRLIQNSFAAGAIRAGDRTLIPADGAYELRDLLLRDDGLPFKRGGSVYKSNAAFGAGGLRWIWDGDLAQGRRTIFADASDYGVLAADDVTPINLGGSGMPDPRNAITIADKLYIESDTARAIYGGSRKTANYSTGTITLTFDSAIVTGSGTAWSANVDVGMILVVGFLRLVVQSVDSDTQLTLTRAWPDSSSAGTAYTLKPIHEEAFPGRIMAAVANRRLLSGGGSGLTSRRRVGFTPIQPPDLGEVVQFQDFHDFPADVLGISPLRDTALVFTTGGVYAISNMAFDLTDADGNAQHRIERVNPELILWHRSGISEWQNSLIVPAEDALWLVDNYSAPIPLSAPIEDLYRSWVAAGYRPGGAEVFNGHYFLPIIDSSANVIATWVCRLDPVRGPDGQRRFVWTELAGAGANMAAFAHRSGVANTAPLLLGAGRASTSRVHTLSYFNPALATDADGSNIAWRLVTRDFGTGNLVRNFVARLKVLYELLAGAEEDFPVFDADVADEETGAWTALAGSAPLDTGDTPKSWDVGKRRRYVRFRLTGTGPATSFVLKALEIFVRKSGGYK